MVIDCVIVAREIFFPYFLVSVLIELVCRGEQANMENALNKITEDLYSTESRRFLTKL